MLTAATGGNNSKCPPTNEWINRMWPRHAMEHCLAIKRDEVLMACHNGDDV